MSDDKYAHARNLPLLGVLTALGFIEWKPRKNGQEWAGKCPVHQPKKNTGSFSFGADGKFNCFSCSAKGKGAIDLLMAIEKVNFRAAVERLEGLSVTRHPLTPSQVLEEPPATENAPFAGTYEKYAVPSPWLAERGLTDETLKRFEVFQYDNPKRRSQYTGSVMLKIRRWSDSECVGYLSRNIGGITPEKPKYRFPAGFHKGLELFGAVQLKDVAPIRRLFLVESPFAVMKLAQLGVHAVSPFGWHVSPQQVAILRELAKGVVYLPDSNKRVESLAVAGELARWMWTRTPDLPEGVADPENLTHDQIRALA